jgi:hypothetical protein
MGFMGVYKKPLGDKRQCRPSTSSGHYQQNNGDKILSKAFFSTPETRQPGHQSDKSYCHLGSPAVFAC